MRRREFLKFGAAAGVALAAPSALFLTARDAAVAATRLSGATYGPKFARQLRRPPRLDLTGGGTATIDMVQFSQQVLDGRPATNLWGYGVSGQSAGWPGPTIVARRNVPANLAFRNLLPKGSGDLATSHLLPIDTTLHMAHPIASLDNGAIPLVPHLHGGHTEWQSDGHPDAWFTQNFAQTGPLWAKSTFTYDNSQQSGTLWYHDHTLGLTRLNVYAGLAGAYLLRDDKEFALIANNVLPADAFEAELVLQDRFFTSDGQLSLPTLTTPPAGITRSVFGDFMLVNGTPWPVLDVEPRKYRFRIVNGSDSRVYVLQFDNANAGFIQVGTELGLRKNALGVKRFAFGPGERIDLVVDFAPFAGTQLTLRNFGIDGPLTGFRNSAGTVTNRPNDTPFGQGTAARSNSTGIIMRFRVGSSKSSATDATVVPGTLLGGGTFSLGPVVTTRRLITLDGRDSFNRSYEMLGTVADGTLQWMDPPTETPTAGTTEVWEVYNTGPVVHPLHLHLVHFKVLDRQRFTFTRVNKPMVDHNGNVVTGGKISNIVKRGTARGPEPYEVGPKDTVLCYPNEVTRVIAKFDRPGNYVWHCHILHHEDHDMMRPLIVS